MLKRSAISIAILFAACNLTGCASNTQGENTGLGIVAGALLGGLGGSLFGAGTGQAVAIGAGAIAGGIIGGSVGASMDSTDEEEACTILEKNPTYRSSSWVNPKNGTNYTMVPTSSMMTYKDNPKCRQYRTVAVVNGRKQHHYGVACRQEDERWVMMD